MRNRKNNPQSSESRKENNNSDAPRKYGRKNFRPKSDATKRRKSDDGSMRLNQYLAHAGICSRREADQLIEAGVVAVNGKAVTQMGYRVQESDIVKFNGRTLKTDKKRYLLLNKPRNYSCRLDDFGKKDSVFELIKGSCKEKILPIGKLNKNHSGLLIFTNDEKMSAKISHPKHEVKKIYHISLSNPLKSLDLKKMKDGLIIDGEKIVLDSSSYVQDKAKTEIGIETKSNKRNIIIKMFDSLNYNVIRLDLVFYGGLTKKDIPRKKYRFLSDEEINLLKRI
ncbi:MAG: S4 domain-containing protein [Flavobacteriales bacterium]|nr:S4 domain-containing protein [Flavobacteriales bacterium]